MSGIFGSVRVDPKFIEELEIILECEMKKLMVSGDLLGVNPKKKCECGGEKAKTTHSDWCPKYEK